MDAKSLQPGSEQVEKFRSAIAKCTLYQYDYRHTNGELFSTVAKTLESCRKQRDKWISEHEDKL